MRRLRAAALVAALVTLLPPGTGQAAFLRPSLLVIVAVDGLSQDRLLLWRKAWTGGFKELLEKGHVQAQANYAHLGTETCPGHAALSTGAPPRVTGIVGNFWYQDGQRLYCLTEPGPEGTFRSGPGNLQADALGDVLGPASRVFALAAKDRAAVMLAGRGRQHAAFWLDGKSGRFVTSDAYDRFAPAVLAVQAIADRLGPRTEQSQRVTPLLPPKRSVKIVPRKLLAERQTPGGRTAPAAAAYRDAYLTDLALAILNDDTLALGQPGRYGVDLLALSYAGPDWVAHDDGDGSTEQLDTLRRLDQQIGRLLAALRTKKGGVLLALSADHGFLPADAPRQERLATQPRGSAIQAMNDALRIQLCLPGTETPVLGMTTFNLYLNPAARKGTTGSACGPPRPVAEALRSEAPEILRLLWPDAIEAIVEPAEPAATVPPALLPFVRNSFFPGRSPDFLVFPKPGTLSHGDVKRGWGHGSHQPYDTHVPLIFWGSGIAAGCSSAPVTPYDLAPTLADYANVRLPQATGRSLRAEIVRGAGKTCR
jgi:hypothetical protein